MPPSTPGAPGTDAPSPSPALSTAPAEGASDSAAEPAADGGADRAADSAGTGAAAATDAAASAPSPDVAPSAAGTRKRRWLLGGLGLGVLGLAGGAGYVEFAYSTLQSHLASRMAGELTFKVEPGPSPAVRYPGDGPYDTRFGYHQLPGLIQRLTQQGFAVSEQARMSPRMLAVSDHGLFPIYREKSQAGLVLRDCRAHPMYQQRTPERVYQHFEAVPKLVRDALLFIENRELLDPAVPPTRNPAVEWDRFGKAVVDQALRKVIDDHSASGGSTLATQIEKYRHSPDGRTDSAAEKLRQMASATLRAYSRGENTLPRRREIVLDYLNTVPLAARAGFGEVNGIGDGLWAWFGRDFDEVNRLLGEPAANTPDPASVDGAERALAFKQLLALMVAQRRPSYYLLEGTADLSELVDAYLRLMAAAGQITPALRDAALAQKLATRTQPPPRHPVSFVERKAANATRARLSALLDVPRAYDLDRFDLTATSTLDSEIQRSATELLRSLSTPAGARTAGLYGFRLLSEGDDPAPLVFSFTLYERTPGANLVRVQTDSVDQPFDLNEGARLDLGSTSKLRTLVTYLELVAELHARWEPLPAAQLKAEPIYPKDVLGLWARDYLLQAKDEARGLRAMLDAAMERRYSASPYESFFTGGGLHTFENFEPEDNVRVMNLREALRRSVNLPFIRLMRDVVHHLMYRQAGANVNWLDDPDDPRRKEYLARFADKEGREFLARFYAKYQGKSAEEAQALLLGRIRPAPSRLAAIYLTFEPAATPAELQAFIAANTPKPLPGQPAPTRKPRSPESLIAQYAPAVMNLDDRGYVAGVHPLELWLVAYLRKHPRANLGEVVGASKAERQEVYTWLLKTRHKGAQDARIRNLLEQDGFQEIQKRWKRLGYPFDALTPSYASALGASGDRPAALAELMGILVNGGVRLPVARVTRLHFAQGTPYETRLDLRPATGERVLPEAVTQVVRDALVDVVEQGTAKRLAGALKLPDGTPVAIGGKTGTGDHRFDTYGRGGVLLSSRVVNRTATLVFLLGERYFGTMMAYVHEPNAAKYKFTSAMPSQLLKALVPALQPMLAQGPCGETAPLQLTQAN